MAERQLSSDEPSDAVLLERARSGDDEAFRLLFERYGEAMRRFAERRLPRSIRRRVSVADVLQEARIVAHRRCVDFEERPDASFRSWLIAIVDRKVRDARRAHQGTSKRSIKREVSRSARPETGAFLGASPTPSAVARGAEAAALAEQALDALPPDYRQVLRLMRFEQLDLTEAAERMGRSREATRKLLFRAVERFGEAFDDLRGEA